MRMRISFLLFVVSLFLLSTVAYAQTGKVTPFRMVQKNGKVYKAENLTLGKPIIIFYFSPECEECHSMLEEILSRMEEFKLASIAMITYLSVESVAKYVDDNNLEKYPNMFVGTEGNLLFVLNYYDIVQFPFIALYTREGNLVKKYYNSQIDMDDLLRNLRRI
jgi:cytochrome oxidase Cu insertion factor (SCO1/SenC/PrrC family)